MKKLENVAARMVNKAINLETFGWPPGCLGTMYQPERPKVRPEAAHNVPDRSLKKQINESPSYTD